MCDRGSLRDDDEPVPHYRIPESIVPRVLDLMHALGRENFNTMTTMDRLLFAKGMTPFKPDAFYVDGMTSPAQLTFGWMQHHGQWMHVTDPQWTDIRPGPRAAHGRAGALALPLPDAAHSSARAPVDPDTTAQSSGSNERRAHGRHP